MQNYFKDPLADWGNDDLLLKKERREKIAIEDPSVSAILDWPELRATFSAANSTAMKAKSSSQKIGLTGALLAGFGSSVIAMLSLIDENSISAVTVTGLSLTLLGVIFSVVHFIQMNIRSKWLIGRIKSERLRQFYFQFLVNNMSEASEASKVNDTLETFKQRRASALNKALADLDGELPKGPKFIVDDHLHDKAWMNDEWLTVTKLKPEVEALASPLLDALYKQRILVQLSYTDSNLAKSIANPGDQQKFLDFSANLLTAGVVLFALYAGYLVLTLQDPTVAMAAFGACGALGLMVRMIEKGMNFQADADRYDWYIEAIKAAQRRFNAGDTNQKILALRDLEEAAYTELRQFVISHVRDRVI